MRDTITLGGVTYGTTAADIISGTVTLGESLTASQLSVDTLSVEVTADAAPSGVYGDPVTYSRDGTLFGKFFLRTLERVGKNRWKIDAVSAIGLLDNVKHYGGLYSGTPSATVIADVIGGIFTATVTGFDDVRIYGWLPIASRRENLQQVLFAIGGNITKDANGDVVISPLTDTIADELGKDRIFLGGKVTYPAGASAVRVTEHSYVQGQEVKELYNGEVASTVVMPPSGAATSGNIYSTSMETTHWYAGSGIVADATGLFDSVLIECEPMTAYVVNRTRIRATGDILRVCWLKELPVSNVTVAYDNGISPVNGTPGETMTAKTTTGIGARYLLVTYGRTADTEAKNTLDVHTVSYTGQLVEFSEPQWGLECSGADICESGPNYVILSQSPAARLTGRGYIHNRKVITVQAEDSTGGELVPEVTDCTLVSLANSANVAQRILAYYSGFKLVEQDVVAEDPDDGTVIRPGDRVVIHDPYGERSGAYIKNMALHLGALLRGSAVLDSGYTPSGVGNNYKDVMSVSTSGPVTLPDTNMVRLVIIGGGTGGNGGFPGEDGKQPSSGSSSGSFNFAELEKDGDDTYFVQANQFFAPASSWISGVRAEYIGAGKAVVAGLPLTYYIDNHPEAGLDPERVNVRQAAQYGYNTYVTSLNTCAKIVSFNPSGMMVELQNYKAVAKQGTTGENWAVYDSPTPGGAGGAGGAGGLGGKIYVADVEITPGGTMTVSIGTGGSGGDPADGAEGSDPAGADGTATTVTVGGSTLTSADGVLYPDGYYDIIGGVRYGSMGDSGIAGGDGGSSEGYYNMDPGGDVGEYHGGAVIDSGTTNPSGSGGGASGTANGGTGTTATSNHRGAGGAGASATSAPSAPAAGGQGGTGGYGGGGGGNAAGWRPTSASLTMADPAPGGDGSGGGDGAPGIVLIYYGDPVDIPPENALRDLYRQTMVDSSGDTVTVTGGYRSAFGGWTIDDFIGEVIGNG